jgi:hypothetical protein
MRLADYVVAHSTIDGGTYDILNPNRNRLGVEPAMAVRDLDGYVVDIVAARVGGSSKFGAATNESALVLEPIVNLPASAPPVIE